MKNVFILGIFLIGLSSFAQDAAEEAEAKKVVTNFFQAFHKQDTLALKKLAHSSIKMQSVGANKEGVTEISTVSYEDFLLSIASIPATTKFEEQLHSFDITVNGLLAHVITPYSFLINDNLSHCGVNSFTLIKENTQWKIVYLIDTRKKEGCASF